MSTDHIKPAPPPKPKAPTKPAAKPATHTPAPKGGGAPRTAPLKPATDNTRVGGSTGSSRLPLGAHTAGAPKPGAITPQETQKQLTQLHGELKQAKHPDDVARLNTQAQDLAKRASADNPKDPSSREAAQFAARMDKANQAVQKLHTLDNQINGTPQDKAVATAATLANPKGLKGAIKDLGPLKDSPLFAKQQANLADLTRHADAGALGKQLAKDPDLSHYPAGFANDLGKLRGVNDPHLQHGLDQVGTKLLQQSAGARAGGGSPDHAPTDPLSLAQVKANPGLGKLIAPLAESKNPEQQKLAKDAIGNLAQEALQSNLDKGGPDALKNFQKDLGTLSKDAGLAGPLQKALPQAVTDTGKALLDKGVSFEQVKKTPALAQVMASLQGSKDPAVQAKLGDTVRGWVHASLNDNLKANDKTSDFDPLAAAAGLSQPNSPAENAKKTTEGFTQDVQMLAAAGLGPLLEKQLPAAQRNVALDVAHNKDLKLADFNQNPAYAEVLGSLNGDAAGKAAANAKVTDLVHESVDNNLSGKEGEGGVKDAMKGVKDDLQSLAKLGLGQNVQDTAEKAIGDKKDAINDTINKGKSFWDKLTDGISNVLGDVGHFVGDAIGGLGDLAGGALKGIGLDGVGKAVSGFTHGVGDAADSAISSAGYAVMHPLATMKGLGGLILHPGRLVDMGKAMWAEASKGGLAHAFGYAFGTVASTMLGGGGAVSLAEHGLGKLAASGAGRLATLSGRALTSLSRARVLGSSLSGIPERAGAVGRFLTGTGGSISDVMDVQGKAQHLGPLGYLRHGAEELKLTGKDFKDQFRVFNNLRKNDGLAEAAKARLKAGKNSILLDKQRVGKIVRVLRNKNISRDIKIDQVKRHANFIKDRHQKLMRVANIGSEIVTAATTPTYFLGRHVSKGFGLLAGAPLRLTRKTFAIQQMEAQQAQHDALMQGFEQVPEQT